jgi:hypothetical protein
VVGVNFLRSDVWPEGEYQFVVSVEGEEILCEAALPVEPGRAACPEDSGVDLFVGAASDESAGGATGAAGASGAAGAGGFHSIVYWGTPETISVSVAFEGEPLAEQEFTDIEYARFYITGSACDPGCLVASEDMDVD